MVSDEVCAWQRGAALAGADAVKRPTRVMPEEPRAHSGASRSSSAAPRFRRERPRRQPPPRERYLGRYRVFLNGGGRSSPMCGVLRHTAEHTILLAWNIALTSANVVCKHG